MMLTDSPVFAWGMLIAALAAGTVWYAVRLRKNRLDMSAAILAAVLGSLFALICAKAGYLLHDMGASLFRGWFDEVLSVEPFTLSFVGGSAGFAAGTALAARLRGVRPGRALDLFAAPGCLMICLARIAEGGMDTIGTGNEIEAEWMKFFPLAMRNDWGDAYLSVFALEAVCALLCLIPALRAQRPGERNGLVMERTAVWLLGTQIFWEMLLQYPYTRAFLTSFVSLEQVLAAVILLVLIIRGCVKGKRIWPVPVTVVLLGISTFFQFFRDNKITFLFEEGWEWAMENATTISLIAFFLISAALIATGLKAVAPAGRRAGGTAEL